MGYKMGPASPVVQTGVGQSTDPNGAGAVIFGNQGAAYVRCLVSVGGASTLSEGQPVLINHTAVTARPVAGQIVPVVVAHTAAGTVGSVVGLLAEAATFTGATGAFMNVQVAGPCTAIIRGSGGAATVSYGCLMPWVADSGFVIGALNGTTTDPIYLRAVGNVTHTSSITSIAANSTNSTTIEAYLVNQRNNFGIL